MKSKLFYTNAYKEIESRIITTLNSHEDFLTRSTASSTRAVGDAVEHILSEELETILGGWCTEYSKDFARRSMADIAFTDKDGFYYIVDVKTYRTDSHFNMPNLTSVERLSSLYASDTDYFVILNVTYHISGTKIIVTDTRFNPIEFLMWDCLTVGALGWGQIQIANSNYVNIKQYSRKKWMLEFCDVMLSFYPKEIEKIYSRLEHFKEVRKFWESKPDE